jgi:hypothetical protein
MQDIKRNRRKMGNNSSVSNNNDIDEIFENSFAEEDMERGFKNKKHDHCECEKEEKCNHHHNDCDCDPCHKHNHHNDCDCDPCHNHNHHDCECEPCEIESEDCFPNKCGPECCHPITPKNFSPANTVPIAIETNRVFDTMRFQAFTDGSGPDGEPLFFETEVIEVNGPVPQGGPVNVTIEKICVNFREIEINPGCITLEDFEVEPLDTRSHRNCESSFEYAVCGEFKRECCRRGLGNSVAFKERGLNVKVRDLVLELKGKCGCTTFTALAFPAVKECGCKRRVPFVVFNFNTFSAPLCLPADGRSLLLRQEFNTRLTVDCIGKSILKFEENEHCECFFDLIIPNDIDLILCLEETVSALISEQIVVLGSRTPIEPRLVDTFAKVCEFEHCGPRI